MTGNKNFDVIIVGGSYAGLSAGNGSPFRRARMSASMSYAVNFRGYLRTGLPVDVLNGKRRWSVFFEASRSYAQL